jgi:endoglucanase
VYIVLQKSDKVLSQAGQTMRIATIFPRWLMLALLPFLLSCGGGGSSGVPAETDWQVFKSLFVQTDGRVIDTGNAGMSHSEGQGVTMLLAVQNNDRATFDAVWKWTQANLQIRSDKLLAWSWVPGTGVTDTNNATDGDVFVAWALVRASRKWNEPVHMAAAKDILLAVRGKLLRTTSRGVVLLPGAVGFEKTQGPVLNLSYWLFPAFNELATADPSTDWAALKASGVALLNQARFGRWGLPPDLMMAGTTLTPYDNMRFGYAAVRVPLYMLWGKVDTPALLLPFQNFWGQFQVTSFVPAWTNVVDNTLDTTNATVGMRGIAQFTLGVPGFNANQLPALDRTQGYYSASLLLLTKLAIAERGL